MSTVSGALQTSSARLNIFSSSKAVLQMTERGLKKCYACVSPCETEPRENGVAESSYSRMLGWAQESTLIPKMMNSSSVSVNTVAHFSCSFQVSPHQTPMVSKAHKCACLSTNCGRKESAHCQASCHSSSEKFKSFHYRVVI